MVDELIMQQTNKYIRPIMGLDEVWDALDNYETSEPTSEISDAQQLAMGAWLVRLESGEDFWLVSNEAHGELLIRKTFATPEQVINGLSRLKISRIRAMLEEIKALDISQAFEEVVYTLIKAARTLPLQYRTTEAEDWKPADQPAPQRVFESAAEFVRHSEQQAGGLRTGLLDDGSAASLIRGRAINDLSDAEFVEYKQRIQQETMRDVQALYGTD